MRKRREERVMELSIEEGGKVRKATREGEEGKVTASTHGPPLPRVDFYFRDFSAVIFREQESSARG